MDGLWKILDENNRFKRFVAKDDSELQPGDIQIYESVGVGHINIYAGIINKEYRYWDAGNGAKGAFKGKTKTYNHIKDRKTGYTCSYRLKTSK